MELQIWNQSRYLAGFGWILFGIYFGAAGMMLGDSTETNKKDELDTYSMVTAYLPLMFFLIEVAGKILGWIFNGIKGFLKIQYVFSEA